MRSFIVKLETISDVQNFVAIITTLDSDFDLISGRYVVDAKSILGIFSLDIQNPMELKIYSYTDEIKDKLKSYIKKEL